MEFDLYTLTGRYYELSCCGWKNQAGRSQSGDWHISVGDEVEAAFKLLCVKHTHIHIVHSQTYTNTHTIYCKENYI